MACKFVAAKANKLLAIKFGSTATTKRANPIRSVTRDSVAAIHSDLWRLSRFCPILNSRFLQAVYLTYRLCCAAT
jgi:hypothetical protein